MSTLEFPPNPNYGKGFFIRSLRLTAPHPHQVLLGMEDTAHAFQILLEHDGHVITCIKADWHRHPISTCSGAPVGLQALVGCPLSEHVLGPQHFSDPRQQCTHMFDMIRLGVVHAKMQRADRRYDVVIKDALVGPQVGELLQDGELILAITVAENVIQAPAKFYGVNLRYGFGAWAHANLPPEAFEHIFMLQRSFLIAHGRRGDHSTLKGQSAASFGLPSGVCYASQPPRYAEAVRLNSNVDYSEAPETILRFFSQP